ncbi:hypothetical protein ACIBIZ_52340 [Nonomuraea spiralis]|uniref:hypothetical protein n=1 Tax=Nonomuraea spiralis TaxID=46182 RepID=UPI0037B55816
MEQPRTAPPPSPRLYTWERRTDPVLLGVGLLFLAGWALFAADYAIRVWLSDRRAHFVATHIPSLLVVLLPLLRPLAVLTRCSC